MNQESNFENIADSLDFVVVGSNLTATGSLCPRTHERSSDLHNVPGDSSSAQSSVNEDTPGANDPVYESNETSVVVSNASTGNVEKMSISAVQVSGKVRRSSESSSEGTSGNLDETVDEWSRSIIVSDVPNEYITMVEMSLEYKTFGGGKVVNSVYSEEQKKMLCVFEDSSVASHFVRKGRISLHESTFIITKPLLVGEGFESLLNSTSSSSGSPSLLGNGKLVSVEMSGSSDFGSTKYDVSKSDVVENQVTSDDKRNNPVEDDNIAEQKPNEASDSDESVEVIPNDPNYQDKSSNHDVVADSLNLSTEVTAKDEIYSRLVEVEPVSLTRTKTRKLIRSVEGIEPVANTVCVDESQASSETQRDTRVCSHVRHTVPVTKVSVDEIKTTLKTRKNTGEDTEYRSDESKINGGARTLVISGIPKGFEGKLEKDLQKYLVSSEQGGGDVKLFKYDERNGTAEVIVEDYQVAQFLLNQEVLNVEGVEWMVAMKPISSESNESSEDEETENLSRSIVVQGVSLDMEDVILTALESSKKNGGHIESSTYDASRETILVRFVDKAVAERFLAERRLTLDEDSYAICSPVQVQSGKAYRRWKEHTILIHGVRKRFLESLVLLLESRKKGGGPVKDSKINESSGLVTITFADKTVARHFVNQGVINVAKQSLKITEYTEELLELARPLAMSESHSSLEFGSLPCISILEGEKQAAFDIEVGNIPAEATSDALCILFESYRITGISHGRVSKVLFFPNDRSKAIVSFTESRVAEQLVGKEYVEFKGRKYFIKTATAAFGEDTNVRTDPVARDEFNVPASDFAREETDIRSTGTVNDNDVEEDPIDNAKIAKTGPGSDEAGGDEVTEPVIEVSNIPADCNESKLRMILESSKITNISDAEVTNVQFTEGNHGQAVVTFSSPKVVELLLMKETISFKDHIYFIRKPIPVLEKNDFVMVDIPESTTADSREKLSSGDSRSTPSAACEVYDFSVGCTTEMLSLIFENKKFTGVADAQILNIQLVGESHAIITFSSEEVAAKLIAKGEVVWKNEKFLVRQLTVQKKAKEQPGVRNDKGNVSSDCSEDSREKLSSGGSQSTPSAACEVYDFPVGCTAEMLSLIFENKKFTGVAGAHIVSLQLVDESHAIITFSSEEVAAKLIAKGEVVWKNDKFLVRQLTVQKKAKEQPGVRNDEGNSSDCSEDSREKLSSGDSQSTSSAACEVYDFPVGCTTEMLSLIFENKKFTGVAGAHIVSLQLIDESHAIITFSSEEVAAKLIAKGEVVWKNDKFLVRQLTVQKKAKEQPGVRNDEGNSSDCSEDSQRTSSSSDSQSTTSAACEIFDFPAGSTAEKLTLIFENVKLTGVAGAKVVNVAFVDDSHAIVTFSSQEVAAKLIEKGQVVRKKDKYLVRQPSVQKKIGKPPRVRSDESNSSDSSEDSHQNLSSGDSQSIPSAACEVYDFPAGCTAEMLGLIFENENYTGVAGAKVVDINLLDDSHAVITFSSHEVAAKLIAKGQAVRKKDKYLVRQPSVQKKIGKPPRVRSDESNSSDSSEGGTGRARMKTVKVTGLPADMSPDLLSILFESSKHSGGGEIKRLDLKTESNSAFITFKDSEVAERLLAKRTVEYRAFKLTITAPRSVSEVDGSWPSSSPSGCSKEAEAVDTSSVVSEDSNTIKVSNLPKGTLDDTLVMYFENTRRSGGGVVKSHSINSKKGKAVIVFKDFGVAERVCQRTHSIGETCISVCALEKSVDVEVCAIEVSGILKDWSDQILSLYFESRRTGGGVVENIFIDHEQLVAVITFENGGVVAEILRRCPHTVDGHAVKVSRLEPAPPPPMVTNSEVDEKRLLAKRLPAGTVVQDLREYFKRVDTVKIVDMSLGKKPSIAILNLAQEPDYMALRRLVSSRPFKGKMISIQKVKRTRSVLVLGVTDDTTDEFIKLYFESKRTGGDDYVEVTSRNDVGVIVTFETLEGFARVLDKPHVLKGQQVKVQPYYEWLGLPQPEYTELLSVTVPHDDRTIVDYISQSTASVRKEIEERLGIENCSVIWPKSRERSIELKFKREKGKQVPAKGWSSKCSSLMVDFLNSFVRGKVNVLQEMWNEFKKQMQDNIGSGHYQLKHHFNDDLCDLHFLGKQDDCVAFRMQAEKIKASLEQALLKKNSIISETLSNLKSHHLMLISNSGYINELKSKYQDLEVQFTSKEIMLRSTPNVVHLARMEILEKCANASVDSITLSSTCAGLLKEDAVKRRILKVLQQDKLVVSFAVQAQDICVCAWSNVHLQQAMTKIRSHIVEKEVRLGRTNVDLLSQPQWKTFEQKLLADGKHFYVHIKPENVLVVAALADESEDIFQSVSNFADSHSFVEIDVDMLQPIASLIERCSKREVDQIRIELVHRGGGMELLQESKKSGFHITAPKSDIEKAERKLREIANSVIAHDHVIDRPGIPTYFLSTQGRNALYGLQMRNRVAIKLGHLEDDKDHAVSNPVNLRLRRQVADNKHICLVLADITKCSADAIIIPNDSRLECVKGLSFEVSEAAGKEVVIDCHSHVKLDSRLLEGQVYVSKPGRLPYKCIIHAHTSTWRSDRGDNSDPETLLYVAIQTALGRAMEQGLQSVAIPAKFAEFFAFPSHIAVRVIVDCVGECLKEAARSVLKDVIIVDNDSSELDKFEGALSAIQPLKRSTGDERKGESRPRTRRAEGGAQSSPAEADPAPNITSNGAYFSATGKPNVLRTAGGVEVTLFKGVITAPQVEGLVNTISKDLALANGAVSKSILSTAGSQIQDECRKNAPVSFNYGDVVETKGYNLSAKYVFHGACVAWDNNVGRCEQMMRKLLQTVLKMANDRDLSSLAMPAIGTGNLRIPPPFVASVMYDEMLKFSQSYPATKLKDIRIVVYDKDQPTISAFEDKIKELSSGAAPFVGQKASANADAAYGSGERGPEISPNMLSKVSFHQSTKTLSAGSMKMVIKEGDITKESADAIVNSTDERLTMHGEVAKALMRAGGDEFTKECKTSRMGPNGLCVTSGGQLPARNVLHLAASRSYEGWKKAIRNCLQEAAKQMWTSITLPLLGTGNRSLTTSQAADLMVESFLELASISPASLRVITICIFQLSMVNEFADAVSKKSSLVMQIATGSSSALAEAGPSHHLPVAGADHRARGQLGGTPHRSRIVVQIYAFLQTDIDDVLRGIEEIIREYLQDKVMDGKEDQKLIAQLTEDQVMKIRGLENLYEVRITVERGEKLNRVRVQGPPKDVMAAHERVRAVMQEVLTSKHKAAIARMAQWEYVDDDKYEPYPDEINVIIENAYKEEKPFAEWEEQDARFRVNFESMEEVTVNGKAPTVKVRRLTKEVDVPSHWTQMSATEKHKLVPLDPNSPEYKEVDKDLRATAGNTVQKIIKIERVQNPLLYKQYVLRKQDMDRSNPDKQNERKLWHGTSADTLPSINDTGFNRSYCGKNATMYGRGVYFARDFSYSASPTYSPPDASGVKYIYQCLALTGDYAQGAQSMIVAPPKSNGGKYDSTVDDMTNPSIFVIFSDTQVHPQYLISFQ